LINVLVKGSVIFNVGGDNDAYVGGLAGLMTGTSSVKNAYSGLDLIVNTNPGTGGSLYVGGIAGSINGTSGNIIRVEEASVVGDNSVGR
jgi:hypothetical protein